LVLETLHYGIRSYAQLRIWVCYIIGVSIEISMTLLMDDISNILKKFIEVEENFENHAYKRMEKVLVKLYLSKGLLEEIKVEWGLGKFS